MTTPRTDDACKAKWWDHAGNPKQTITDSVPADFARDLERELAAVTAERDALKEWQREQLQVESEWDAQSIASMFGAQPGQSCRKVIATETPKLLANLATAKAALEIIGNECPDCRRIAREALAKIK